MNTAISYIIVPGSLNPTSQTFTFLPSKGTKAFYKAGPSRPYTWGHNTPTTLLS